MRLWGVGAAAQARIFQRAEVEVIRRRLTPRQGTVMARRTSPLSAYWEGYSELVRTDEESGENHWEEHLPSPLKRSSARHEYSETKRYERARDGKCLSGTRVRTTLRPSPPYERRVGYHGPIQSGGGERS